MNNLFYPKLAAMNIKKNGQFYFPYILTCVLTAAIYYIICFLRNSKGLQLMPGSDSLDMLMEIGTGVVRIFSCIFLFYTNSFLMKRRKTEMGLYNILGMEKRHIGRIMCFEMAYTAAFSMIGGIFFGIMLSRLSLMVLCKIVLFPCPLGFEISMVGIRDTAVLFGIIFVVTLIGNLISVYRSKPIELLSAGHSGEREPKSKWILALAGVLCIGAGYYFALTADNALEAVNMFFIAVALVVAGTYSLFTAGSIMFLKFLKKNKAYYYQTRHFTSVSGMLYRMKQNAVGLSNICILCTMVLVIISTTVCLYIGSEDSLNERYPYDIDISEIEISHENYSRQAAIANIRKTLNKQGVSIKELKEYEYIDMQLQYQDGTFATLNGVSLSDISSLCYIEVVSYDDYVMLGGAGPALSGNETLVFSESGTLPENFMLGELSLSMKKTLNEFPLKVDNAEDILGVSGYKLVVSDSMFGEIEEMAKEWSDADEIVMHQIFMDLDAADEDIIDCASAFRHKFKSVRCRAAEKDGYYAMYGGFLFLGIFLGIIFLMATVLIIYYKQISEGYDDRERFIIMQKVGMSKREVRDSIRSQVMTVFLLPVVVAGIHIVAAFRIIRQMLAMFGLVNLELFITCTALTLVAFVLVYMIVYRLTSRVYYRIVEAK